VRRVVVGAGKPAVVLEAGMNCGAASWERVMPLLAPHVRVAAYDRPGLGGSAPAPGLAVIDRQVGDLTSVITGLAAGPCVLAGHSWGGILVQLLAFRRPDLVAGLVLVDPGHEEMEGGLPLALQWSWRIVRAVHPDELHGDVAAADAALRELRAAAPPPASPRRSTSSQDQLQSQDQERVDGSAGRHNPPPERRRPNGAMPLALKNGSAPRHQAKAAPRTRRASSPARLPTNNQRRSPEDGERLSTVPSYLSKPVNACQASAVNVSVPPSRSVVSRTATLPGTVPTSTQLPPPLPL
jgi:pimeloyl-ACP methyl ester carboxylesterase